MLKTMARVRVLPYRVNVPRPMYCGDGEDCGNCRVCRRLEFLEWCGAVAPRDIPHSIERNDEVDDYIKNVIGLRR